MSAAPEILDYCETTIGTLCLRRRELLSSPGTIVTEVTLDHEFLMSSYHTESERALASLALEYREGAGDGVRVLVGGLGLGYTARAALDDDRVAEVEVLELLPEVISWLSRGLIPLAASLRRDRRFGVREEDVFRYLNGEASRRVDAILLDIDHSPDEPLGRHSATFYSREGLARAREHLSNGGVLAVWSSGSSEAFSTELRAVFSSTKLERIDWYNELIDRAQTDYLFLARR